MKIKYGLICIFLLMNLLANTALANHKPRDLLHNKAFVQPQHSVNMQGILLANGSDKKAFKKRKEHYDSLPEAEKKKIKKARKQYEVLSKEEKKKLKKRWEDKPDNEKNRYKKWQKPKK